MIRKRLIRGKKNLFKKKKALIDCGKSKS